MKTFQKLNKNKLLKQKIKLIQIKIQRIGNIQNLNIIDLAHYITIINEINCKLNVQFYYKAYFLASSFLC